MRRSAAGVLLLAVVGLAWASPASAGYKAKIAGGKLTLTGNGKGDKLVLRLKKGARGTLQVDVGANGSVEFAFARKRFSQIVVNAGGGNDSVAIVEKNGVFTNQEATQLNGGSGNDKLTGGAGPETLSGGPGNNTVAGKGGSDVFLWSAGDGNDKIDGAEGADAVSLNGSAGSDSFLVNPASARVVVIGAGSVLDVGTVETVDINTLGGDDTITVSDLAATDVRNVAVDLGAGDLAADAITVNGTAGADVVSIAGSAGSVTLTIPSLTLAITNSEPLTDTLTVNALGGADIVSASGLASTSVFRLYLNGGADNDILVGSQGNDFIDGGDGDDLIHAGDGGDTLNGGAGTDVIDGGAGIDTAENGETVTNVP